MYSTTRVSHQHGPVRNREFLIRHAHNTVQRYYYSLRTVCARIHLLYNTGSRQSDRRALFRVKNQFHTAFNDDRFDRILWRIFTRLSRWRWWRALMDDVVTMIFHFSTCENISENRFPCECSANLRVRTRSWNVNKCI